jgi:predicted AlkP superfamily phosphohydrolase/phosphomutase
MAVTQPKLTVIGLDAATLDVIEPLVAAGDLPQLGRLLGEGAHGRLRSTTHPLTPLAWTTMTTGANAGRHGIWDFAERDESGYGLRLVNGSSVRVPPLWTRLDAAGRRVGIVNVPYTWPAPPLAGFAVAGMDAWEREDGMTTPPALLAELRDRFGRLLADHSFPLDADGRFDLDAVRALCEQRIEIVSWLAERYSPELLFVVFMAADHVHHLEWPDWERRGRDSVVAEVYRILDGAVGALLERVGGENVLVVSDHGGGSLEGVVNLNAWLAREGYLAYTSGGDAGARLGHRVFEARRRVPSGLRRSVKQRAPFLRERAYALRQAPTVVDWSRTRAFAYGIFGSVVVNLRGRERDGIVDPEEYEALREELASKLADLRDPAGEPIVAAVHRREDLFRGPELTRIPDLVVEFRDYAWLGKGNLTERSGVLEDGIVPAAHPNAVYSGSHRPDGLFVLAGPAAQPGARLAPGILDVAPTVFYLLDEPIPLDFEGSLLTDALEPGALGERPARYAEPEQIELAEPQEYDEAGAAALEERLRDLGYLE